MTDLGVDQWQSWEAYLQRAAQNSMSLPTAPWLLLGTSMKSSEGLSDLMLVRCVLVLSWFRTLSDLMWPECIVPVWQRHWCHSLAFSFPWPNSNWGPIVYWCIWHCPVALIQIREEIPLDTVCWLIWTVPTCWQEGMESCCGHTH